MEEKFIPYEKMSKKAKREQDRKKRSDWGEIDPSTFAFKSDDKHRYKRRNKHKRDDYYSDDE